MTVGDPRIYRAAAGVWRAVRKQLFARLYAERAIAVDLLKKCSYKGATRICRSAMAALNASKEKAYNRTLDDNAPVDVIRPKPHVRSVSPAQRQCMQKRLV